MRERKRERERETERKKTTSARKCICGKFWVSLTPIFQVLLFFSAANVVFVNTNFPVHPPFRMMSDYLRSFSDVAEEDDAPGGKIGGGQESASHARAFLCPARCTRLKQRFYRKLSPSTRVLAREKLHSVPQLTNWPKLSRLPMSRQCVPPSLRCTTT